MRRVFALFPVILLALAACGTAVSGASSSTGGATSTATATKNCLTAASGTIQQVGNGSLVLTTLQGKSVQVTLTGATTYTRQSTLTSSQVKTGTPVSIIVTLNTDNTYSALSVSLRGSQVRQGGFTGGAKLCSGQGLFPGRSGTPRASGTPGGFGGRITQTITGTVSQVNGSALTVTDTSGTDINVNLTAATRITAQVPASISDLHSGIMVSVIGTANSQGVISANSVAIVQGFPNRRPGATVTPTTSA